MSVNVYTKNLPLNLTERDRKFCKGIKGLNETTGKVNGGLTKIKKIKDELYEAWYGYTDDEHASKVLTKDANAPFGGACSAAVAGGYFARNYDWFYDGIPEVLVHTEDVADHHAVVGMCRYSEDHAIIPYLMTDGINEFGMAVCMNVVPAEGEDNEVVVEGAESVNALSLVYLLLSKFEDIYSAKTWIEDGVGVFFPKVLHDMDYEIHIMLADSHGNAYAIEFVENAVVVKDVSSAPYMTNFLLNGVTLNNDGTVYTPYTQDETHNAVDTNGVTEHGSGLERWNIIVDAIDGVADKSDMVDLMASLAYTQTYTETTAANVWYSEFVGGELTAKTAYTEFEEIVEAARDLYTEEHSADPVKGNQTWWTTHCSIYDLAKKSVTVILGEDYANVELNGVNTAVKSYAMLEARIAALEDAE